MRECLDHSVIRNGTCRMAEACGKLDEIRRISRSITRTHLGVDVKLDTLALRSVFPSRGFFRRESTVYLELYLTGECILLTVSLKADITALFELLLKAVSLFGPKESNAGDTVGIVKAVKLGDDGLAALGKP